MKYISLSFFALLFFVSTNAQTPFKTIDSITINKISASVLLHGDMWWNPATKQSACTLDRTGKPVVNFAAGIWMSGYDAGGQLHLAAQTYRQDGNDYWPGPLDASDTLTYGTSYSWAKIWKVERTEIQMFQDLFRRTVANVPQSILTWPGKGNVYAKGNNGLSLSITSDMAPFVDVNGNGIYDPLHGDYPDVKGDQALWWVFSDKGPTHTQTNGKPLGVEVHAMSYAYNRGSLLDYMVYYEYDIVNRSSDNYNNFRFGMFDDVDLGSYLDDFLGFDSSRRLAICYNGTNNDGQAAGFPANSYGPNPPQVGITMIVLPGDAGTSYVPAGSFGFFNNDASIWGNPVTPGEYNNYLRSRIRNGQHFVTYSSPPCMVTGPARETNYMFSGDPADPTAWSECICNNAPGDRRMVLASNDFALNAGSSEKIAMALVVTSTGAGGCGGAISFDKIREASDAAWNTYHNPPAPLPLSQFDAEKTVLDVYPNPASTELYVEGLPSYNGELSCTAVNTLGQAQTLQFTATRGRIEVNIDLLPPGVYLLLLGDASRPYTTTFVKE